MRILRSAVLLLVAATPLAAQSSRFSLTPLAGWSGSSPLLQHTVRINEGTFAYTSEERVTLGSALNLGARLGVQLSPGWTLYLQGTSARSRFTYRDFTTERDASGVESAGTRRRTDDATSSTATLELARSFALAPGGADLELSVGGGLQHISLALGEPPCEMEETPCLVQLPSPVLAPLDVPSVVAGLALRQPIGRALSAEVRSTLLLGRLNTEGFQTVWEHEAPAHQMVRRLQASFGLSWRP
ncbi:MAG: hypothetical protein ACJ8GN_07585 [Longimicrobiaceae bacterium]